MTESLMFAWLTVFLRVSAMVLTSPIFGGQTVPISIRVLTTIALSGALTMVVQPHLGPVPSDMFSFAGICVQEIFAGILIGVFTTLALQVAQVAGSIMDLQVGLSMSQTVNPVTGISVTILAQYKNLLGMTIFLGMNGHHLLIDAVVKSYSAMPGFTIASPAVIQAGILQMMSAVFVIAIQVASPVIGVSLIVDGAMGLINRAVPQMQAMTVGLPAKIALGLIGVSVGIPSLALGVNAAVGASFRALTPIFRM